MTPTHSPVFLGLPTTRRQVREPCPSALSTPHQCHPAMRALRPQKARRKRVLVTLKVMSIPNTWQVFLMGEWKPTRTVNCTQNGFSDVSLNSFDHAELNFFEPIRVYIYFRHKSHNQDLLISGTMHGPGDAAVEKQPRYTWRHGRHDPKP